MRYIYLQEYVYGSSTYFYVGKHSWPGQGIDPSYHGSSSIVHNGDGRSSPRPGWSDGPTTLLEVTTPTNHNQREVYWINHYATLLGISVMVPKYYGGVLSEFVLRHQRAEGRLLNGHIGVGAWNCSGEWWVDYYGPYTLQEGAALLGVSRTALSTCLSELAIDKESPQAQFFFHGHWIHRRLAVYRSEAPSKGTVDAIDRSKSAAKMADSKKKARTKYTLKDGFEGDYEQIAAHIGYPGRNSAVLDYLKHPDRAPRKWREKLRVL